MLVTQDTLDLGEDGVLTNAGLMIPGGEVIDPDLGVGAKRSDFALTRFVPQTTDLDGSLVMTSTSRLVLDASFRTTGAAGDGSDLIRATGSATVDGVIKPVLLSFERAGSLTFIETGGSSADNGAVVRDTATVDFSIALGSVELVATPRFALPGMTGNEQAVGAHINSILTNGGSAALGPLFAYIGNMTDPEDVAEMIGRLTTEGYGANRVAVLRSGLGFADTIGDCERRMPADVEHVPGRCWWLETEGARFNQDAYDDYAQFETRSFGLTGGLERALDDSWTLGFAAGIERIDLTSGDSFSSSSDRGNFGVALRRETGALTLGGALTGGFGNFSSDRDVGVAGTLPDGTSFALDTARSKQSVIDANLRLNAAYAFENADARLYAIPAIHLDASYIYAEKASESGLGAYGMEIGSTSEWVLSATPTVEVGGRFDMENGARFRPYFRGGFTVLNKDELKIDSAFIGAPDSAAGFQNYAGFDNRYGRADVGFAIESADARSRLDVGYQGAFSAHSESNAFAVNFSMRF